MSSKKHYKEKVSRKKEEKQELPEAPKYRDRAKERREDQNPDYEPTELGSFHAVAPPGTVDLRVADAHKISIENSKYLGGDIEHTHLVKGLDYALLNKVRSEMDKKADDEDGNDGNSRYHAEHGPKWRKLADVLGKSRVHVKDAWRRIRLPNLKKGKWSQDEYQSLFDLVNLDLRMKAYEEKKANHCMLKDNISWEAISDKMSTRASQTCCMKWYYNLASSMVKEGSWNNLDDYKLIEALQKADACCFEDVDWDNLLAHRSGEICRKRWHEMIRHLHNFWALTFIEQVDLLSARYSPDMIQYREMEQNKNHNV